MKVKIMMILVMTLTNIVLLNACGKKPETITFDQAGFIAQPYFQELYGKNVVIERIKYERVSQSEYRNFIVVSYGEMEYELVLDKNNKPLADNLSSLEIIRRIDVSMLADEMKTWGLILSIHSSFMTVYSYSDMRYIVNFSFDLPDVTKNDSTNGVYRLISVLRERGVDELIVVINTPDFLLPKKELYGSHGVQLDAEFFSTDINLESYEVQYRDFINRIHWDKQKFEDKRFELTQLGCENVSFFIKERNDPDTIEVFIYYESDSRISDDRISVVIKDLDESYFRIGEKKTKYTVEPARK